jgi:hypothetical protein
MKHAQQLVTVDIPPASIPQIRTEGTDNNKRTLKRAKAMDYGQIQMTSQQYEHLAKVLLSRSPCNLLIWGVGRDMAFWLDINRAGKTVFLEDNAEWLAIAKGRPGGSTADIRKVTYSTSLRGYKTIPTSGYVVQLDADLLETAWDIIIVDAPAGNDYSLLTTDPGRMGSIYTSYGILQRQQTSCGADTSLKHHQTDIIVHDTQRPAERLWADVFFGSTYLNVGGQQKGTKRNGDMRHYMFVC